MGFQNSRRKTFGAFSLAGLLLTVATPALATDWSGAYLGAGFSKADSENNYYFDGALDNGPYDLSGDVGSLFAGYNVQNGNYVFGGELALTLGAVRGLPTGFEEQEFSSALDIKGRVGYATGSVLFYGALGYSVTQFAEDYATSTATISGFGYGVGVDYAFNDRFFAGVEYYRRNLSGDLDYALGNWTLEDTNLDTITLRVGMNF